VHIVYRLPQHIRPVHSPGASRSLQVLNLAAVGIVGTMSGMIRIRVGAVAVRVRIEFESVLDGSVFA
jgi:hypothetical protein